MPPYALSRRSFLAFSATLPWAFSARAVKSIPAGLELYSVRDELKKDPEATVPAVAQMGYQGFDIRVSNSMRRISSGPRVKPSK